MNESKQTRVQHNTKIQHNCCLQRSTYAGLFAGASVTTIPSFALPRIQKNEFFPSSHGFGSRFLNLFVMASFSIVFELCFSFFAFEALGGVAGSSNSLETIGDGVRVSQSRGLRSRSIGGAGALLSTSSGPSSKKDDKDFLVGDAFSARVREPVGTSFLRGGTDSVLPGALEESTEHGGRVYGSICCELESEL